MSTIIVSRHKATIDFLLERKIKGVDKNTPIIGHVDSPEQIRGKHVVGNLTLSLAAHTSEITVLNLKVPEELRGKELNLEQLRSFCESIETFSVVPETEYVNLEMVVYQDGYNGLELLPAWREYNRRFVDSGIWDEKEDLPGRVAKSSIVRNMANFLEENRSVNE